jgi:hypothetical protein
MLSEARKIHLIEELIKINNDDLLLKVEELLDTFKEEKTTATIYDFVGALSKSEAGKLRKAINA